MATRYKSKIDTWLAVVLVSAIAISIGATYAVGFAENRFPVWVFAVNGLLGVVLPAWLLLDTSYVLDQGVLRIRCGPFRWTIRATDIRHVEPTRSALSSPALSLDRIRIDYGSNKSLMVSPRDSSRFLKELDAMRSRR